MWPFARKHVEPAPSVPFLPPGCQLRTAVLSDAGLKRRLNEDSARVYVPEAPRQLEAKGVLVVVADGMGGHLAGEVSSRMAVETVGDVYYRHPGSVREALVAAFEQANDQIHRMSQEKEALKGTGTTCTALVLVESAARFAHVGDSRLYLVRNGEIRQMTEDHSLVMEQVRQGHITLEQARKHSMRNVILRALGTQPQVEVASPEESMPLEPGDRFVLCSDGLHEPVSAEEIGEILNRETPEKSCERLVALACERGGKDNVTVAVVEVEGPASTV